MTPGVLRCPPEPAHVRCVWVGPHSRLKGKEVPPAFHYVTHCKPLNGDRMNQTAAPQNPYPELDAVLYTRLETAQLLKISRKTVANLIRSGQLSAQKAGSRVLIPRAALLAFLEAGQK